MNQAAMLALSMCVPGSKGKSSLFKLSLFLALLLHIAGNLRSDSGG